MELDYGYCPYTTDGQHVPLVLPEAAGGKCNKCSECGLTLGGQQIIPESNPF